MLVLFSIVVVALVGGVMVVVVVLVVAAVVAVVGVRSGCITEVVSFAKVVLGDNIIVAVIFSALAFGLVDDVLMSYM